MTFGVTEAAVNFNPNDPPFQALVAEPALDPQDSAELPTPDDGEWSIAALEEAYQRALESADAVSEQVEQEIAPSADAVEAPGGPDRIPTTSPPETAAGAVESSRVLPEQVLEALLFVGGEPLTARRLADLLGGEALSGQRVDAFIEQLNVRYADQQRPYQILPGEGGYRLALHPEYESVRNRVYGLGPRDIRLSQDALEVLALIAYQQPVDRAALEATGKSNVAAIVRHLLRLELIALERGDGGKDDICYRTTPRFLQLFALERIEELPHPEDLMFK